MNVLVLGGNGYIGSKITSKLVKAGHFVICTRRTGSDLSRLDAVKDKIRLIPASVDAVESAMEYVSFDYVLNMVCNYGRSNVLYGDVLEANIEFPLKVLNSVVEHGTRNFLTIGTGLPNDFNMYSFSKKMFSEFGRFYSEKHQINFNSLLLEMFYGADEPRDRFLSSLIHKMIFGELVETTKGTQHRDIISAEDIVKAILMVVDSKMEGFHEIPVGTGESPTISEIVDFIWDNTGRKSMINKGAIPMRKNEPDSVADTEVLRSIGNWNPIFWKDGLKKMIDIIRVSNTK